MSVFLPFSFLIAHGGCSFGSNFTIFLQHSFCLFTFLNFPLNFQSLNLLLFHLLSIQSDYFFLVEWWSFFCLLYYFHFFFHRREKRWRNLLIKFWGGWNWLELYLCSSNLLLWRHGRIIIIFSHSANYYKINDKSKQITANEYNIIINSNFINRWTPFLRKLTKRCTSHQLRHPISIIWAKTNLLQNQNCNLKR